MNWMRENIDKTPSFIPFLDHIEVVEKNIVSNPTICVETCKSLLEGICKTILMNKDIKIENDIKFHALIQKTIEVVLNTDEAYRSDISDLGRRIGSVSQKLGEIRNNVSFVSHGMDVLNPKLTETISIFACKITDTIGGFILSCYINNRVVSADHRIHYEDCKSFNDDFDDLNPMSFELSASLALFAQDYEAYKVAYYDYIERLGSDVEILGLENDE